LSSASGTVLGASCRVFADGYIVIIILSVQQQFWFSYMLTSTDALIIVPNFFQFISATF